jgi:hypothetical protein
MTSRTSQCKVFWALLSSSKHSGVPEDSKSPTLGVLGFTPALGQSGVATQKLKDNMGLIQKLPTQDRSPKNNHKKDSKHKKFRV